MSVPKQSVSALSEWVPTMRIVPPLHEDFAVYGNAEIKKRARDWAYVNRIALVENLPACAHGFYVMRCPGKCSSLRALDHASLFIDCSGKFAKPFLLAHPYLSAPHRDPELRAYAQAHGLEVERGHLDDHWYMPEAPPVRLCSNSQTVPFPIELTIPPTLTLSPIRWRCDKVILGDGRSDRCQRDHEHRGKCCVEEDEHNLLSTFFSREQLDVLLKEREEDEALS